MLRRLTCLTCLLLTSAVTRAMQFPESSPASAAPAPPPALIPDHGAASTSFAPAWTGAFITGNGTLGAMVMGGGVSGATNQPKPQEDPLFLSHAHLFLPTGSRQVVPDLSKSLDDVRQTIRTRGYGPAMMS